MELVLFLNKSAIFQADSKDLYETGCAVRCFTLYSSYITNIHIVAKELPISIILFTIYRTSNCQTMDIQEFST